jgi:hypothetical protein
MDARVAPRQNSLRYNFLHGLDCCNPRLGQVKAPARAAPSKHDPAKWRGINAPERGRFCTDGDNNGSTDDGRMCHGDNAPFISTDCIKPTRNAFEQVGD